ncbi:hypothetical protein FYZ48_04250 [Gimesia chilikensis]|uniref:M56 family metallopeptidase n=1 Tax=Gimesia chilikensis TaxID=2605989 RepID=UPI0011EFE4C0|nr:M56 family metallopeptidase [Gimesia chilikensis]KAA0140498.1 hypothetical protein FYZ48_04250 [Gimesia chilikensis]
MNGLLLASDLYVEITDQILELLIIPTMIAGLLAGLVLLINLFARKWLTAGQMGLLWALVLIRLAVPYGYAPESSYSLTNLFVEFMEESTPAEPPRDAYAPEPWPKTDTNATTAVDVPPMHQIQFPEPKPPEVSFTETLLDYLISFLEWFLRILPPFWFIGALFILTRMLVTHWRFSQKINRLAPSTDQRLLKLWNTCCDQVHFRRSVPVIVTDDISQPSVLGALRPKLLLPTDLTELSDSQLQLIMLHELAHLKQRDLWVNWFLFGLKLLHWWNPLYCLAVTRYSSLREQSRDAMVLRWREQQDNDTHCDPSREFSELLLTLAQRDPGSRWRISLPVSLLGFLKSPFRKRSLANRLKALRTATNKEHPLRRIIVISTIVLFAFSGLTDAKLPPANTVAPPVEEGYDESWSELDVDYHNQPSHDEPFLVLVYDLTSQLKKIRDLSGRTEEQARQDMLLLVQNQLLMQQNKQIKDSSISIMEQPQAKYHKGNQLIVRAPQSLQADLRKLIAAWGQSGLGQIKFIRTELTSLKDVVDPSFYLNFSSDQVPPALRKKLKLPTETLQTKNQKSSLRIAILTPQQKQELIQKIQSQPNYRTADHQQLTLFNGQKVLQTLVYQPLILRPYVVNVLEGEATQPKLKIRIFEEGVRINLSPTLLQDQKSFHLSTLVETSEITEVKTYQTQIAGKSVSIKTPDVTTNRCQLKVEMKSGQSLLIAISPTQKSESYHYMLLEAEILPEIKKP